jgi:hypothetical protein
MDKRMSIHKAILINFVIEFGIGLVCLILGLATKDGYAIAGAAVLFIISIAEAVYLSRALKKT